MSDEKLCAWCGTPVRGRWATLIMPDGEEKHLHGKCRWFPESYKKLGLDRSNYSITEGPDGQIMDFRESRPHTPFIEMNDKDPFTSMSKILTNNDLDFSADQTTYHFMLKRFKGQHCMLDKDELFRLGIYPDIENDPETCMLFESHNLDDIEFLIKEWNK